MPVLCIYCCDNDGTTDDHVIPKSFFPAPRPTNLITVKCCPACQQKYKKDEDLIRAWFCFGPAGASEVGKTLWEQKLRKTIKKDSGVRYNLARSMGLVDVKTPAGLYLGKRTAVAVEGKRVYNFFDKIVRGLFWLEYRERLPKDIPIDIHPVSGTGQKIKEIIQLTGEPKVSWEKRYEYRHLRPDKNTFESMWIMSFFGYYYFLVFVGDNSSIEIISDG